MTDFAYVESLILDSTGSRYAFRDKNKYLEKFGRTLNADSGVRTTVAEFQGNVVNETFAEDNTISHVVSDSVDDTGNVTVEGHTVDPANGFLTFAVQTVSLLGRTPVPLSTPLFRANRVFRSNGSWDSPAVPLVGNVYVYDSTLADGVTNGTPDEPTATKAMISAGRQNSFKCATSISNNDVWWIDSLYAGIERISGSSAFVDIEVEFRELGGVWRSLSGFSLALSTSALPSLSPVLPITTTPPNCDIRMVATSSAANCSVFGSLSGPLAKRVGISGL